MAILDFDAKSSNWFFQDKTNFEGGTIDSLTPQLGLHLVIKEPTHISDTFSLCVDLIFTSQINLINESGVHSFLNLNWHHHIICAKFHLESIYPPGRFGTIKMLILYFLDWQLMNLISKGPL